MAWDEIVKSIQADAKIFKKEFDDKTYKYMIVYISDTFNISTEIFENYESMLKDVSDIEGCINIESIKMYKLSQELIKTES